MKIGYHAGVWDLFHAGHLGALSQSRKRCDFLIVGVVSDDGVEEYKDRRPVTHQEDRLSIVGALACVNAALLQPGTDPSPVLIALERLGMKPDVMFHGDDWAELREGSETLEALGIAFETVPYGPGQGTTGIIERIREADRA